MSNPLQSLRALTHSFLHTDSTLVSGMAALELLKRVRLAERLVMMRDLKGRAGAGQVSSCHAFVQALVFEREIGGSAVLLSSCSKSGQLLMRAFRPDCQTLLAVGQNQWYHFGIGALPILVYSSGDWDVHWRYAVLTHGHLCQWH